jgi:hypothetical protein
MLHCVALTPTALLCPMATTAAVTLGSQVILELIVVREREERGGEREERGKRGRGEGERGRRGGRRGAALLCCALWPLLQL